MNRCKDCKFWKAHVKRAIGDRFIWGLWNEKCYCSSNIPGHGICISEKFVDRSDDYELPPADNDALSYSDSEGYMASFQTGPMFGCVHWEARQA